MENHFWPKRDLEVLRNYILRLTLEKRSSRWECNIHVNEAFDVPVSIKTCQMVGVEMLDSHLKVLQGISPCNMIELFRTCSTKHMAW